MSPSSTGGHVWISFELNWFVPRLLSIYLLMYGQNWISISIKFIWVYREHLYWQKFEEYWGKINWRSRKGKGNGKYTVIISTATKGSSFFSGRFALCWLQWTFNAIVTYGHLISGAGQPRNMPKKFGNDM